MCKVVLVWLVTVLILLEEKLTPGGGDKEKGASPKSRWSTVFGWSQSRDLFRVSHVVDLTRIQKRRTCLSLEFWIHLRLDSSFYGCKNTVSKISWKILARKIQKSYSDTWCGCGQKLGFHLSLWAWGVRNVPMEQTVDGKGCGCETDVWEKQLKQVQDSERECEVHFRRPWSAHWPRRTHLTVLEGGSGVISQAEEEGTEAMIHPGAVEGGKDRSSAWVISTAITEGACHTGRGDFSWAASAGSNDFCL